jgi:hypothetical protein
MIQIIQNHNTKEVEIVSERPNYLAGLAEKSGQELAHAVYAMQKRLSPIHEYMYMGT